MIFALIGVLLSQPVSTYIEKKFLEGTYQMKMDDEVFYKNESEKKFLQSHEDLNAVQSNLQKCLDSNKTKQKGPSKH